MFPYRSVQRCALVALALAALVSARPGGENEIAVAAKPSDTESSKDLVDPKPSSDKPVPAEVEKSVNEKYPHALLFGRTCGGTIISPTWVLTAGHCTLFSGGRSVLAGTNKTDDGSGVRRRVKRLVIHPLFTVGPYWLDADEFNLKQVGAHWDFLLVELEDPLPLDSKTMVAATLNEDLHLPAGLEVDYAGYGTDHHGGYMRHEMHGMELEVKEDGVCKAALEQFTAEDMICTKGRAPRFDSACNGDSGSGLVDAQGRLVGVASWVEGDAHECRNGALVIFSKVAAVRDWIRQVTKI